MAIEVSPRYRLFAAGIVLASATGVACSGTATDPNAIPRANEIPRACTLIGCDSGLKVTLEPGSGWPDGRYRFEIEADQDRASCTGSLPLRPCAGAKRGDVENGVTCDRPDIVRIVESGCALPSGSQGFPVVWFDPRLRPSTATVTVLRNDEVVGRSELRPQFQTVQPNGPGCEPVCHMAGATLTLRF